MPRPRSVNLFPDYIRVRNPDQKRLAELTVKAMGDRSLSEFATQCGVYASTLSRLIKAQTKGPCSEKLIEAIWENASEDMGIDSQTFKEMLLDAYGLVPSDKMSGKNEIYRDDMPPSQNLVQRSLKVRSDNFDALAREIIIAQLVGQGYTVKQIPIDESSEENKYFKFALSTDALKEQKIEKWYFEPMYGVRFPSSDYIQNLYGYLYANSLSDQKKAYSIIVSHKNSFDEVRKKVEKDTVHDYISVILIDMDGHRVTDEFILRQAGKDESAFSFIS